ncbi:MAG: MBL fold metallo-hydrolase [Flavobacteriaceae bacterium]|nr:MBL fold metallo-hydrolase [Flavobacteriaceae bacterium]
MKIEQLYTKCLAEATYYVESEGEVVIIDPLRETAPYIAMANADNARIKYIFLTHFHADFVSGHVDLARETGATIVYGPSATANFDFHVGQDNEEFKIGAITLKLLHTPGHTLESSSFLLFDEAGKEQCLFSGDALFIGDVGRPDLAVSSLVTKEELAAKLYHSLRDVIVKLPDNIIIYPNHGKGSACGKNMSNETFDTLGNQKKVNYALNPKLSKEEFVEQVLDGLTVPPQYFPKNAMMNKVVNTPISEILTKGLTAITAEHYQHYLAIKDVLFLDVRSPEEFTTKHIINSVFIGLDGTFSPWVGELIENINQRIILITPVGREEEAITRLSRIGYDNVLGYIKGGVDTWEKEGLKVNKLNTIVVNDNKLLDESCSFLDVRRIGEFNENSLKYTKHLPLSHIYLADKELDKNRAQYVYCAGGYRSVIAISILNRLGFNKLINIEGGFSEIKSSSKIPLKECRRNCPTCACSD